MEYVIAMRILLVEDEADVRHFLARALGHVAPAAEVVQAVNGADGLARFEREPFDLILSDHKMPRMTGVELLRAVRSVSDIPFLIITADRSIERDALAAGVSDMLNKPIALSALRDALARHLPA
jgi:CheY-like chemotaxis protein